MAEAITKSLAEKGCFLDLKKIRSAALLHDIARTNKNHAVLGAAWLDDLGHTGISSIVGAHMELEEYDASHITEKTLVYLADKLVFEDRVISLTERFGHKMKLYHHDDTSGKAAQRKYEQALQVEGMINRFLKSSSS